MVADIAYNAMIAAYPYLLISLGGNP